MTDLSIFTIPLHKTFWGREEEKAAVASRNRPAPGKGADAIEAGGGGRLYQLDGGRPDLHLLLGVLAGLHGAIRLPWAGHQSWRRPVEGGGGGGPRPQQPQNHHPTV